MDDHDNGSAITLIAKFGKSKIELKDLPGDTTIEQVKWKLCEHTHILPKRQKLIGLSITGSKKGQQLPDDAVVSELQSKSSKSSSAIITHHQFILMGTPEEEIFVDPHMKDDLPDVIDDFELDFTADSEEWVQHVDTTNNLKKFTESTVVHIMNQPRAGKPLMVLDLDHTLLDFSTSTLLRDNGDSMSAAQRMKRPYMDEFLASAYRHYDLVVWSQTSWRWLETKLIELGMVTNPNYHFCFVLDKTSMFAITSTKRDGSSYKHHIKPLQIIWSKFPRWGAHNTVHLDDLARNFALNPESGLKVTPYYRKKSAGKRDVELIGLARYLEMLATSNTSFDKVKFSNWLDVIQGNRPLVSSDDSTDEQEDGKKPAN